MADTNVRGDGAAPDLGGVPAYGNQRSACDDGERFDWENPEYRRA